MVDVKSRKGDFCFFIVNFSYSVMLEKEAFEHLLFSKIIRISSFLYAN